MPSQHKNGVSGAMGGKREGAGRPSDWLKEKCREIVTKHKIIEFLADVATGENVEQAVGNEGEVISVPAAVRDRIKATELLLDRGYGKADQALDITTHDENRPSTDVLIQTITALRAELDSSRTGVGVEKGS